MLVVFGVLYIRECAVLCRVVVVGGGIIAK